MCGIVAYFGNKNALPVLIDGLKKLEYRGYDSAGICLLGRDSLFASKVKGRVSDLEKAASNLPASNIGIAHTRWATHGEPSEANAHPHFDCKKEIAIVHNGIIENYNSLKEILKKEGHIFVSQTDSEVVSHLIEKFYNGNLEEAVMKALKLIEGTFGLAIICKKEQKVVVARRGSPIVLGVGEGENIIASDAVAVLPYTKKVIYLNDNEIAVLTKNNYSIKNFSGQVVEKEIDEIKWSAAEIEKKGYKHFMLKEMFEQPDAVKNTLRGRIDEDLNVKLSIDVDLKSIKRIIIVACGTAWHAGLTGKYLIEKMARIPVEVDYASEFRYRSPIINKDDLFIAISQSGETADTLAALREAKAKGAKTLGIINVVGSTMSREVDSGIFLHAGPEIAVAATKSFPCMITAIILFTLFLIQKRGGEVDSKFFEELNSLPEKIDEVLHQSEKILLLAKKFKDTENFFYLGREIGFPIALEGALKAKETSYAHAEGYPAGEMKHGHIALVDKNLVSVFIATRSATYSKILSNMEEVKARGGKIIALVNSDDKDEVSRLTENIIIVPKCSEYASAIINTIPLQLLAYHIADLRGIDVDKPKNLAKSVTVE